MQEGRDMMKNIKRRKTFEFSDGFAGVKHPGMENLEEDNLQSCQIANFRNLPVQQCEKHTFGRSRDRRHTAAIAVHHKLKHRKPERIPTISK